MNELALVSLNTAVAGFPIVSVSGELDHSNYAYVGRDIERTLPEDAPAIALDLSETRYIDSSGVRLLFELRRRLGARGQTLHVIAPPASPVWRVLSVAGVDALIPIHRTKDDAAGAANATPA